MPRFRDQKIRLALDVKTNPYSSDFSKYVGGVEGVEVASEASLEAVERAYFAKKLRLGAENETPTERLENRLVPVLAEMESRGVFVDGSELRELADELRDRTRRLEAEMTDLVGEPFNPNSPRQLQYVLFEKLGVPRTKKIKTGFSVDAEALEEISKQYAIAALILEYRSLEKLRTTYAEGLLKEIDRTTGRIHTTYNQVLTSTGRLSSENPNLQNVPSGDAYAGRIKAAFRPSEPSWRFLVADYSQVELRILAVLSGDGALKGAFADGRDIHAETAKFLFPASATVSKEERRIAKTVNFGVIYGITGFGLSKTIGTSPAEASRYIDAFFARYSGVREYYDRLLENARKTGYVETLFGRRRYVKGLNDANMNLRKAAEREAMNMPVQGTAADAVKMAMVGLRDAIVRKGLESRMIMQVHDELVFEGPESEMGTLEPLVREIMETVLPDSQIRLPVDVGIGPDWFAAKG